MRPVSAPRVASAQWRSIFIYFTVNFHLHFVIEIRSTSHRAPLSRVHLRSKHRTRARRGRPISAHATPQMCTHPGPAT